MGKWNSLTNQVYKPLHFPYYRNFHHYDVTIMLCRCFHNYGYNEGVFLYMSSLIEGFTEKKGIKEIIVCLMQDMYKDAYYGR